MDVARLLFAHRGFPREMVASRRLVVVAQVQARGVRQCEQPVDGTVQRACIAAREVRACGAIVGHEQRVADEHRLADAVRHAGRRMAGRVHHLDLQPADCDGLPVAEKTVEFAAVAADILQSEHGGERALHLGDARADADRGAGFFLQVRRCAEMVRVCVRLQHPVDGQALASGEAEQVIRRAVRHAAGAVVVVQHRIDDRGTARGRIPDHVADRVGGFVELRMHPGLCHGRAPGGLRRTIMAARTHPAKRSQDAFAENSSNASSACAAYISDGPPPM